jgi:hypothetical protein
MKYQRKLKYTAVIFFRSLKRRQGGAFFSQGKESQGKVKNPERTRWS